VPFLVVGGHPPRVRSVAWSSPARAT
jgi:hypothetical protein